LLIKSRTDSVVSTTAHRQIGICIFSMLSCVTMRIRAVAHFFTAHRKSL